MHDEPVTTGEPASDSAAAPFAPPAAHAARPPGDGSPQPPPPPWRLLPPPPPERVARPAAAAFAVAAPPTATRTDLAPGRRLLVALAVVAASSAVLLLPGLVTGLAVVGGAPGDLAIGAGSSTAVGALQITSLAVLATIAAVLAGVRWLRAVRRRTGDGSIWALLGGDRPATTAAASGPASGPPGRPVVAPAAGQAVAPARRSTVLATAAAVGGVAAVLLGELAWHHVETGSVLAGPGGRLAIGGAIAIVLATSLLPSILRAVERREITALGRRDGRAVWLPPAGSPGLAVALAAVAVGVSLAALGSPPDAGRVACGLDDGWSCRSTRVPVDHFAADRAQPTIDVAYAVHEATDRGQRPRRVLLIATGGPGASGIDDGAWMIDALDDRIRRAFDVVTFDARGVGLSDGRDCPGAAGTYAGAPLTAESARALVEGCIREAHADGEDLRRYATTQVVEDIDAVRRALGIDRFTLYGSSYGTVVAQAYAAAHPDRLDGLVLDAPIDRTLSATHLWSVAAHGFRHAVQDTLAWCSADPDCGRALPDAGDTYRRLLEQFDRTGAIDARVTRPDGTPSTLTLTRSEFDLMTNSAMYGTTTRTSWLRALAAVNRADRRPLVHLFDAWSGPGSGSTFGYYATWCADVRASPTARDDDFDGYLEALRRERVDDPSSIDVAAAIAPCVFWPAQPASSTTPAEATTVPTLILTASDDPITPVGEAEAIAARLPLARLIETQGGGHGSLGSGCADERMADFVVDARLPVGAASVCPGRVSDPFVPLADSPASTARSAATGLIRELIAAPEVIDWDGTAPLRVGCADSGSATLTASPAPGVPPSRAQVTLDGCAWVALATFDGAGTLDIATGDADLDLHATRGDFEVRSRSGSLTVTGTWDGRPAT